MALTNSYLTRVYETVQKRNPNEPEFQQAVLEVLESFEPVVEARPELEKNGIIERIVEYDGVESARCLYPASCEKAVRNFLLRALGD